MSFSPYVASQLRCRNCELPDLSDDEEKIRISFASRGYNIFVIAVSFTEFSPLHFLRRVVLITKMAKVVPQW